MLVNANVSTEIETISTRIMKRLLISTALASALAGTARADFNPISLTAGSFSQDMVVERNAPHAPPLTTATMDNGAGNTGFTWYEIGYDQADPSTGIPQHGTTFTSESAGDHSFAMAPSYLTNDAVLIDSGVSSATLTLTSPSAYSALSFLVSSGNGSVTINYVVHHADGSTDTGNFSSQDWFSGGGQAYTANGRVSIPDLGLDSVNNGFPKLYSADITLTHASSAVTNVVLTYGSGGGHAGIFAVSGSSGGSFSPIAISGYNKDMIVEAAGILGGGYTTASMDAGTANNGFSWYEQGYNLAAPTTGLPAAGSNFLSAVSNHRFTMPSSYSANNAALIDSPIARRLPSRARQLSRPCRC
jgi:hypothetical protein